MRQCLQHSRLSNLEVQYLGLLQLHLKRLRRCVSLVGLTVKGLRLNFLELLIEWGAIAGEIRKKRQKKLHNPSNDRRYVRLVECLRLRTGSMVTVDSSKRPGRMTCPR